MESFEVQGMWHAPDNPDHEIGGTLRVSDDDFTLTTIGSLSGDSILPNFDDSPTRILGIADGKKYTLDDCYLRGGKSVIIGVNTSSEVYAANRVIRGASFDKDEEVSCRELYVRMKHFAEWFGNFGISASWKRGTQPRQFEYGISFKSQRATICRWNDMVLRIGHWYNFAPSTTEGHSLREDRQATLKFKKLVPIEDALSQMSGLQDLITIAAQRPAEYTNVQFGYPGLKMKLGKKTHFQPIEFIAPWNVRDVSTKRPPRHAEMLFTFDTLGGGSGVAAWMKVAEKYRSELRTVVASRFRSGIMVEDRFFRCAAALEGIDKVVTGPRRTPYRTRLERLANRAGQPFETLVGDVDRWLDRFKDARHDYAHHLRRGFSGTDLLFLGRSGYWLCVLCLLRDANAPESVFTNITKNPTFEFEGERVRALLGV